MDKKLKAYEVREPDEGNYAIVFSNKNVVARREGAGELGCEFEEVESCTRAPWADKYAPGPVPLHASLAAGWWHTCGGCGCEFDADGIRGLEEDELPGIEPMQDSKGSSYCSPGCMMKSWQARREQKARDVAAVEHGLSRWPQALRVWPYRAGHGGDGFEPNACQLLLPGLKNRISWVFGEAMVSVAQIDVPEFQRLYGTPERAQAQKGQA